MIVVETGQGQGTLEWDLLTLNRVTLCIYFITCIGLQAWKLRPPLLLVVRLSSQIQCFNACNNVSVPCPGGRDVSHRGGGQKKESNHLLQSNHLTLFCANFHCSNK